MPERRDVPAERVTDARAARATLVVGAVALVVGAAVLVPWQPVPGDRVSPVPVLSVFTPGQVDRAEGYAGWARLWSYLSLAVSLAVAGWFGLTGRGRRLVERLPVRWWLQVPLAVAALTLLGRLVTLPAAVALQRLRLDEGLSTQDWAGWGRDLLVGQAVTIMTTSLALLVLVGCARRLPRAWPAVVGGLLAVLVVVGSFGYPLLVEPLFNRFEPLPDGSLRSRVLALAETEGVAVDDVLVADASRRTTSLNAYVSGFGDTRRVVVYDTLVDSLDEDEALSVVAHELAHARHDDVVTGTLLGAAGALAGVGLLGLVLGSVRRRDRSGTGAEPGSAAVVPLVLALVALATFVASPVQAAVSRQLETRADVDAVRATGDAEAFASMQRRVALRSLSDPTPPALAQLWFATHPSTLTRIAVAERVAP